MERVCKRKSGPKLTRTNFELGSRPVVNGPVRQGWPYIGQIGLKRIRPKLPFLSRQETDITKVYRLQPNKSTYIKFRPIFISRPKITGFVAGRRSAFGQSKLQRLLLALMAGRRLNLDSNFGIKKMDYSKFSIEELPHHRIS
ncbi:glutamate 5-kinase [Striga asiatica]|uniref:Glutamate 5-kinase n=1 Tax=Striga asiatica TaxID=4170 RepID=A0A5A7QK97_STRAF|nr:glutamate 5-kinase [Striga asiatica]